jgi:UDP-glucose 4-epimerase
LYVKVNRFRIVIESRERTENNNIDIGIVTLFDLAGSESQGAQGENASQETKLINKVHDI